jgi:hypothetical protein
MALATVTMGSSTVVEFFTQMKGLADEMASAGKKLDDDEVISYILMGVGEEFDSVTSAVANRVDPISLPKLQAQLVSHEQCREIHDGGSHSSANIAMKGGRGGGSNQNPNRGRGGRGAENDRSGFRGGKGRGGGGRGHNFQEGVICQVYGKEGHSILHRRAIEKCILGDNCVIWG